MSGDAGCRARQAPKGPARSGQGVTKRAAPTRHKHKHTWRPTLFALIAHGPGLAVGLLLLIFVGGTFGYAFIEGWGLWESFYQTVIMVTTVGYREVHPLSEAGQRFTVVLLLVGVGSAAYTFSLIAALMVGEGGIRERLRRRRVERMLDELDQHFIVCGFGRIGSIIVQEFIRQEVPFVVIERDPERVHRVMELGGLAVEADASREEVLSRVRIDRARGLIAAVGSEAENVYTVLTARLMRPELFIVGRAETDDARRKLTRAGADRVLSPYQLGALQMAQTAIRPAVVDFLQLATGSDNLDLTMEQVRIHEKAPLAGRSLIEANLRQRFGVVVVGIQRSDGHMEFNPSPDTTMAAGDYLVVLGRMSSLKELEAAAQAVAA
jgi:voltage-gated potassium channel